MNQPFYSNGSPAEGALNFSFGQLFTDDDGGLYLRLPDGALHVGTVVSTDDFDWLPLPGIINEMRLRQLEGCHTVSGAIALMYV